MISKEEIKKLADLARIDIEDKEMENLRSEMDAILTYVGQVSRVTETLRDEFGGTQIQNVMREDIDPTESETFNKELIAEFPARENNYLKVKKIL